MRRLRGPFSGQPSRESMCRVITVTEEFHARLTATAMRSGEQRKQVADRLIVQAIEAEEAHAVAARMFAP